MQKLFFIASLMALVLGLYWPRFFKNLHLQNSLGTIVNTKGSVNLFSRHKSQSNLIKKKAQFLMNDSLSTGDNGSALIQFKRGAAIRLLPNSDLTLLKKSERVLLALRRGDIEVIDEGQAGSVLVSRNGEEISISDYSAGKENVELWIDPTQQDTVKLPEAIKWSQQTQSLEGGRLQASTSRFAKNELADSIIRFTETPLEPLTDSKVKRYESEVRSMINSEIAKHKTQLYHCYTQLIQKSSEKEGLIELHFTVNPTGKIENTLVIRDQIKDPNFEKCLLQTFKRTRFKSFQGDKITAFLPLRFDRNQDIQ